ncbi:MAG TPA: hypothetical protein PKB05_06885 [Oligoflexia bacterium]|nr:hypothetical protein [Oligoflexia bacterium]
MAIASLIFAQDIYVIKHNDYLSCLSEYYFGRPVYGDNGSLSKLKALNPQLENANTITVGQILNVPKINPDITQNTVQSRNYNQQCLSFQHNIKKNTDQTLAKSSSEITKDQNIEQDNLALEEQNGSQNQQAFAQEVPENITTKNDLNNRYQVVQTVYQNLIHSMDQSNASISNKVSEENFALATHYQHLFWNTLWSGINFSLDSQHYELEFGSNGFQNFSPYLWGVAWINDYQFKTVSIGLNVDYKQEPFIVRVNSSDIGIEKVHVFLSVLEAQKRWNLNKDWLILSTGQLIYPFYSRSSLNPQGKLSYLGELAVFREKAFGSLGLGLGVFYEYKAYDTDLNQQKEKQAGINLHFRGLQWL